MIKTEHLSKAFGEIKAVDNIGIEITDNSIFGLAGTNGEIGRASCRERV